LDGLPRAILWAASRWGVFGTDGLVERLRGTVPKALLRDHEALVAALDDEVRAAIEAMTIFAGDFTADDAETVLGDALNVDVVEALTDLHDRTLLHRTAPGTFRVPRLVRQVVPADPSSPLAERHVAWCLQRSETERWRPPEPEVPDVVQAVQWLIDQGDARVGSLLVNLASSPSPGRYLELAEQARQHAPSPDVHRAHARILRLRGRFSEAAETLREGLALAGSDCRAAGPLWRHWGVLHHTTGDWEAAREGHEQALACARELSDVHGIALATANLGTIDHDRCAYEDAEQHYAEAMQGLRAVDDPHVELTVRVNQAVLWQELGKLDAAEPAYRQALVLLERTGNARTTAITLGNLGLLLHEQGRLDEAEPCLRDAFERVGSIEDPKSEALCLARLAAVHADQGRVEPADRAWESATWTVQQADDVSAKVVDLFGAFVDLAHGREPVARARLDSSEAVLQLSGDARIAARMLRRRLSAAPASLQIDETGFVPPGGERVDLSRHASIRRMFQALVQTARQPGQSLDVAALFAAGWPDERIGPDSMRNRVHVNLAKLRRWGLKTLIERTEDGYRLQATVVGG
ncbi:MAG: tetratricopeptide repeat protein, partial [Myxococcota bacterium]